MGYNRNTNIMATKYTKIKVKKVYINTAEQAYLH